MAVRRGGRFQTVAGTEARGNVSALLEDRDGSLWIGMVGGGLARISGGELARFTSQHGLTNDKVWSLTEDAEGSLWIGCLAGGLNRLRDSKLTPVGLQEGLLNDQVRAVVEDAQGVDLDRHRGRRARASSAPAG